MRNKLLIGIIFFAVLAAQFSCSQIRQVELERNRSLWRESKIENYKMTIEIHKTGHATPSGEFIIIVRGGVAKSMKFVNKPDVELLSPEMRFGRYETIEDIFNFIESAEKDKQKNNRSWSRREIEYDAKFGYPKKVDLDQSGVFDDELFFEVLEFEVIESSDGKPAEKPLKDEKEGKDNKKTTDEFSNDGKIPKTISGGVLNSKAVELPKPVYPAAARAVKASGAVNVQVTVDEKGNITEANAVLGHPLLRQSAVAAARQAKFKPTLLSGTPVKVTGVIVYNFAP